MTRESMVGGMLAFALVAMVLGDEAQAADAGGTWTWIIARPDGGKVDVILNLKQEGNTLTGKMLTAQGGRVFEVKDGKIEGDQITFNLVLEVNGIARTTKYMGTQLGDSIKGKIVFEANGGTRSNDWAATRLK